MSSFRLAGIDHEPFEPLFSLDDARLRERGAVRCVATGQPGFPCRVSLEDAKVGEELLLLPFVHQPGASPYRASGPIFVRRGAKRQILPARVVPPHIARRLMSVRAYDAAHMMIDATVTESADVASSLDRFFANADTAYVHLHNTGRGCFSCTAERVG
ncbi:MAG TPA: DUF1203 domain-containing protein [Xanthomonadaceae bacterium]|jgi:hypothetical protein